MFAGIITDTGKIKKIEVSLFTITHSFSEPLTEGMEVSGFIESTLYVSSDAKDTDFTIKIIDNIK